MTSKYFLWSSLLVIYSLLMIACSDGGIEGTGVQDDEPTVSYGSISGFGSIFINGIEYETDEADVFINGRLEQGDDSLRLGMVVLVDGVLNADGLTGIANTVVYDQDVEGPVSVIERIDDTHFELTILGLVIQVNNDTEFEGVSRETLALGQFLTASGFRAEEGRLMATRVEKKPDGQTEQNFECEMIISQVDAQQQTFVMGGLTVDYSALVDGFVPQPGLYVEVKGTEINQSGMLIASEIALDELVYEFQDQQLINFEGVIGSHESAAQFKINGYKVDASTADIHNGDVYDLRNGVRIELSGVIGADGVVMAQALTIKFEALHEISGTVSSIEMAEDMLTVAGIDVFVDSRTRYKDGSDKHNKYFGFSDIALGDAIHIKANYIDDDYVATSIENLAEEEVELKGVIARVDDGSFLMMGVLVDLSMIEDMELIAQLQSGMLVKAEGEWLGDKHMLAREIDILERKDDKDKDKDKDKNVDED